MSSFQKTEKILYIFPDIEEVNEPFLNRLRECLERLKDDEDFDIIDMKYFQQMTHEEIAEFIDVDPSTVTRRKNRIVKRLSFMLFPSDAINELLNG
jgi:RNA polymerase sigma factor (sigma-70 family)